MTRSGLRSATLNIASIPSWAIRILIGTGESAAIREIRNASPALSSTTSTSTGCLRLPVGPSFNSEGFIVRTRETLQLGGAAGYSQRSLFENEQFDLVGH